MRLGAEGKKEVGLGEVEERGRTPSAEVVKVRRDLFGSFARAD